MTDTRKGRIKVKNMNANDLLCLCYGTKAIFDSKNANKFVSLVKQNLLL